VTLLIATGLRREARIMAGPGLTIVAGGGDGERLEAALEHALAIKTPDLILSSGLAGALDPTLMVGDVVMDSEPRLLAVLAEALPHARSGSILGRDAPIASASQKSALHAATGAMAVDMESHIAARVAARHRIPFAAIRVISDSAGQTLPPAALVGMRPDGGIAIGAVLRALALNPGQLPALLRTARDAERGLSALARVHHALRRAGIGVGDTG
jgi:hypothetical protein